MHRMLCMGGTRNLKLGATWGKGQGTGGQWKSACEACGLNVDQGWNWRGEGVGVWTPNPSSCLHTLIFEQKSAINFDPWAKFQTSTSECAGSFHNYYICQLLSSHLDKCIVTLGHFSTTNISTGGQLGGKGTGEGGSCAPRPLWRRPWCYVHQE